MRYAVEYLKRAHGADIVRWAARGLSLKQVGRALGRQGCEAAPQTVKAAVGALGLKLTDGRSSGRWRRGRKPEIARRRKRALAMAGLRPGLTYREIGARFGITGERVRQELIVFPPGHSPSRHPPSGSGSLAQGSARKGRSSQGRSRQGQGDEIPKRRAVGS